MCSWKLKQWLKIFSVETLGLMTNVQILNINIYIYGCDIVYVL